MCVLFDNLIERWQCIMLLFSFIMWFNTLYRHTFLYSYERYMVISHFRDECMEYALHYSTMHDNIISVISAATVSAKTSVHILKKPWKCIWQENMPNILYKISFSLSSTIACILFKYLNQINYCYFIFIWLNTIFAYSQFGIGF